MQPSEPVRNQDVFRIQNLKIVTFHASFLRKLLRDELHCSKRRRKKFLKDLGNRRSNHKRGKRDL